jgi:hypothetical protein
MITDRRSGVVMNALDMFSGKGGWASAFRARGHHVVTTDLGPQFECDVTGDILDDEVVDRILALGPYDVVLASPPCEGFSVMNIGKNWTPPPDNQPKTETARMGVRLVERTLEVIRRIVPAVYIIENPRAKLRKLPVMDGIERRTVTYCQYGHRTMKPTDLWGGFPPTLELHPICKNGAPCHDPAPRGSKQGVQGIATSADRALVPYALSEQVCIACEEYLAGADEVGWRLF